MFIFVKPCHTPFTTKEFLLLVMPPKKNEWKLTSWRQNKHTMGVAEEHQKTRYTYSSTLTHGFKLVSTKLRIHNVNSVVISEFYCHSDLTWNQFGQFGVSKTVLLVILKALSFNFWENSTFEGAKIPEIWTFWDFWVLKKRSNGSFWDPQNGQINFT